MAQSAPATNLINDGAVIRIEKNGKTLLVAKDQVKTIDTVHDNIVDFGFHQSIDMIPKITTTNPVPMNST